MESETKDSTGPSHTQSTSYINPITPDMLKSWKNRSADLIGPRNFSFRPRLRAAESPSNLGVRQQWHHPLSLMQTPGLHSQKQPHTVQFTLHYSLQHSPLPIRGTISCPRGPGRLLSLCAQYNVLGLLKCKKQHQASTAGQKLWSAETFIVVSACVCVSIVCV